MQQVFERIFDRLYVGYGIHFKSREIIILFSVCRYAQFCAFISVIELPRIPAYCPKSVGRSRKPGRKKIHKSGKHQAERKLQQILSKRQCQ